MRGALVTLEHVCFKLKVLFGCKLGWGHAYVLYVADAISLREAGVVHGARVPEDLRVLMSAFGHEGRESESRRLATYQISRLKVDLL